MEEDFVDITPNTPIKDPPSFVLFKDDLISLHFLTNEQRLEFWDAVSNYQRYKPFKIHKFLMPLFEIVQKKFDKNIEDYQSTCQRNKENRRKSLGKNAVVPVFCGKIDVDSTTTSDNSQQVVTTGQNYNCNDNNNYNDKDNYNIITIHQNCTFEKSGYCTNQIPLDFKKEAEDVENISNIEDVFERFKIYWLENQKIKKDWLLTWKQWLAREKPQKLSIEEQNRKIMENL